MMRNTTVQKKKYANKFYILINLKLVNSITEYCTSKISILINL